MFIRLSTAFVMLLGLTALVSAGAPIERRDNAARAALVSLPSPPEPRNHMPA
ncbi:hypothetical protein P692DRAFT_20875673 [Suillus brevipes Sb2]|nr:hypothetical protein P692DRAFT_20875673 [Suillus brevipes Sb2]